MLILEIRVIELTKASIQLDTRLNNCTEYIKYIKHNQILLSLISRVGLLLGTERDLLRIYPN